MKRLIAMCVVALAATGCGGETKGGSDSGGAGRVVSCQYTETIAVGGSVTTETPCSEISGLTSDQIEAFRTSTCTPRAAAPDGGFTLSGVFSDGRCPLVGILTGCRMGSGSFVQTTWFYRGNSLTVDMLDILCAENGGTSIPPP